MQVMTLEPEDRLKSDTTTRKEMHDAKVHCRGVLFF